MPRLDLPRRSHYSVATACTFTAGASGIDGAAAFPPCALSVDCRFSVAFVRPTAFRGAIAGFGFLAALGWAARFRPGLAAAVFAAVSGVAFFCTADLTAALALAFLAAHRVRFAATIRARPSGLRRRFFLAVVATAGFTTSSALAFRTAAQRFLCAAAMRLRAAALNTRFVAVPRQVPRT